MKTKTFFLFIILIGSIFGQSRPVYDYLVITPDVFLLNATWDEDLVALQNSRGFSTVIESIQNGTSTEQIRTLISNYCSSHQIKYVLLVGGAKNINGVIYNIADFSNGNFIPFYSVYSANPWESTGASNIASDDPYLTGLEEYGIKIGRVPASTITDVNNYVEKLEIYYQSIYSSQYNEAYNKEIVLGLNISWYAQGATVPKTRGEQVDQLLQKLKNDYIPSSTSLVELKVSEHNYGCSDFEYCEERENIFVDYLNQGASVISILSTIAGRDNLGSWYWNDSPINNINNKYTGMPFLVATSCQQGEINQPGTESIMRKLLVYGNGGIIGAIAPTEGSSQLSNGFVLNKFHELLYSDQAYSYGEICNILKTVLKADNFYSRYEFYINGLVYYGDPSLESSIYKHRSGNIASNTTWKGNYVIDAPLTVESDITLNLSPGTNLFFNTGVNFTVDGTLYANKNNFALAGLTNDHWGYLDFTNQFSSGSYLTNCEVINSVGLKFRNGADIMLDNNHIKNSTQGIYIYNSQPQIINNYIDDPVQNGIYGEASGLSPIIQGNKIYKYTNMYSNQGIYLGNNTNARIIGNDINGFLYGAYLGGGCYTETMLSDGYSPYPNNRFMNNRYGITTAWGSSTIAGWDDETAAFNSIYGNQTYDAYCYQYSWFQGYCDYWGANPQLYGDGTSFLDVEYFLTENPWDQKSNKLSTSVVGLENKNPTKSDSLSIFEGILLERQGKINQAINFYKKLIHDEMYVDFAFAKLLDIKNRYERKELKGYFKSIANSNNIHKAKLKKIVADLELNDNLFYSAISNYNSAISTSNSYDGINAQFAKMFAYTNVKNDIDSAAILLSELKQLNLTEAEFLMKLQMADNLLSEKRFIKTSQTIDAVVNSYDISQNYPNPFNPSTKIRYQIPEDGMVTLKVYDILGREIKTLVNDFKTKGRYEVTFDASRLASGLYIYEIKSGDYKASKKMTLIK